MKTVYSRGDKAWNTLIVRDLYTYVRFDRFGVKRVDQLERIFHIIIGVLSEHRTTLLKQMRFNGDALRNLLDGLITHVPPTILVHLLLEPSTKTNVSSMVDGVNVPSAILIHSLFNRRRERTTLCASATLRGQRTVSDSHSFPVRPSTRTDVSVRK